MIDILRSTQGCSWQPHAKSLLMYMKPFASEACVLIPLFSLAKCMSLTWCDGWAVILGVCISLGLKGAITRRVFSSKRFGLTHTGSWHLAHHEKLTSSYRTNQVSHCLPSLLILQKVINSPSLQHKNVVFFLLFLPNWHGSQKYCQAHEFTYLRKACLAAL